MTKLKGAQRNNVEKICPEGDHLLSFYSAGSKKICVNCKIQL